MAKAEPKQVFLVFARWSAVDTHYELVDHADTMDAAEKLAEKQKDLGAINTRVEVRELPEKKGAKNDKDE